MHTPTPLHFSHLELLEESAMAHFIEQVCTSDSSRLLGQGFDGLAYRISETLVAKFPLYAQNPEVYTLRERHKHDQKIKNDHGIATQLFREGIRVPRPIAIKKLSLQGVDDGKGIQRIQGFGRCICELFIMEYISGVTLDKLNFESREYQEAIASRDEEIRKATQRGFSGLDLKLANCIWSPEKGGAVLIDFAKWKRQL